MVRVLLIILILASVVEASQHIMQGDAAGGALSGTYPNPTLAAGAVPVTSSGIAFGSPTNAMTQNTGKLLWDNTHFELHVGSNPYTRASYNGSTFDSPGLRFWNQEGEVFPYVIIDPFSTYGSYLPFQSSIGDITGFNYNNFQISHSSGNVIVMAVSQFSTSGQYIIRGIQSDTFFRLSSTAQSIKGPFAVNDLTASRFVTTDSSKNLISYDLLNTTQTWTGGNAPPSKTVAQLQAITPTFLGMSYYCSDCTNTINCLSTGTANAGSFSAEQAANRTTACQ